MRWIVYNALFAVAYLAMMPKFLRRMKKRGGYRAHFAERFGRYEPDVARKLSEKPRIWVHAVSVGEANLAGTIVKELRRRDPAASFVLSTTSSTGRAVIERLAGPDDVAIYLPLDFPTCVRRAVAAVNARALVLAESEFWPNLLRALHRKGVPLVLANGRVSDRSAPGYRRLKFFFGPVFGLFDALLVQSARDRDRLIAAGAPAGRIEITGSVKFDVEPPSGEALARARAVLAAGGIDPGRDIVLLGGSTWPGEELALASAWRSLLPRFPALRLVLVPRHAERAPEVVAELSAAGFRVLRSRAAADAGPATAPSLRDPVNAPAEDSAEPALAQGTDGNELAVGSAKPALAQSTDGNAQIRRGGGDARQHAGEPEVLCVDLTGVLFPLYSFADAVFVGKTLPPNEGGQNMIEPCSFGKATICGPHVENFVPVMEALRSAGAVVEVPDAAALEPELGRLLSDADSRAGLGRRAGEAVAASRGALARTASAILRAAPPLR